MISSLILYALVTCTAISKAIKDPGTGFSTCPTNGYRVFAPARYL